MLQSLNSKKENYRRQGEEHFDKYEKISQAFGIENIKSLVLKVGSLKELEDAYDKCGSMNCIPLEKWDLQGEALTYIAKTGGARRAGLIKEGERVFVWAAVDWICIMKHVARHHVLGINLGDHLDWCDALSEYFRSPGYVRFGLSRDEWIKSLSGASNEKH